MSDTTLSNNDYARALYRHSVLDDEATLSSVAESSGKAVGKTVSKVVDQAQAERAATQARLSSQTPASSSAAQIAESHELGVLPPQDKLSLQDASLYKSMLGELPSKLGFDMSQIMQTIFKSMLSMQRSQSDARMTDLLLVGTAYKQAASQMRSSAAMELTGSVVSSGLQLVGAGLSMAGTAYSAKSSGLEYTQQMKPFTVGNQMLDSSSSVLKGGMNFASKTEDADASLSKAAATHAQALRENEDELHKEVSKFVDQMLQIIQSIENQQHAASSQILSA